MKNKFLTRFTQLIVLMMLGNLSLTAKSELIKLSQPHSIAKHHPILIAHRGGIITPESPECSLTAIRLAAASHYDMIELDIQMSQDGVPMVFHDRTLTRACGKDGSVADYMASELESIKYLNGKDSIVRLDRALEVCRELGLGIMLDLKAGGNSVPLLREINRLIIHHQLEDAAISITGNALARKMLMQVRFTTTDVEMDQIRKGKKIDLSHRFWFGLPKQLKDQDIEHLKASGALVIPAINTFRYPKENHLKLAEKDIKHLRKQGVDGFQIDSIYDRFFQK